MLPSGSSQPSRWLIVGGGGFDREIYTWTLGHLHGPSRKESVGFLDDNSDCLSPFPEFSHISIQTILEYTPESGDQLLMAIADPIIKLDIARHLVGRGAQFASFIHPTAVVSHDLRIGIGCVVCPLAVISCNVRFGEFVSVNAGAVVGHDSVVQDGCTLSPCASVSGQVVLERGVFLGSHAVVLPRVPVGEFARIGAGSTVLANVRAKATMVGVPAKRFAWSKELDDSEQDF